MQISRELYFKAHFFFVFDEVKFEFMRFLAAQIFAVKENMVVFFF